MFKEINKIVEVCDGCQNEIRQHCKGCGKAWCYNGLCHQGWKEFQRRVKKTSIYQIIYCPDCLQKDIPLLKQLQKIEKLREEWWALYQKYDDLADEAEYGIGDGYYED